MSENVHTLDITNTDLSLIQTLKQLIIISAAFSNMSPSFFPASMFLTLSHYKQNN